MPEMDGFELTAAIRAHDDEQRRFPIVAITANALQGEAEHCLAAGMDDYLSKPLEKPKLKAALRKWMPWPMVEPAAAGIGQHDNGLAADAEPAAPPVDEVPGDGPIDPSALMGMFGDDPQTFREILQDFPAPARANIDEIETAVAERSAGGVAGGAHKLKGTSKNSPFSGVVDLESG